MMPWRQQHSTFLSHLKSRENQRVQKAISPARASNTPQEKKKFNIRRACCIDSFTTLRGQTVVEGRWMKVWKPASTGASRFGHVTHIVGLCFFRPLLNMSFTFF